VTLLQVSVTAGESGPVVSLSGESDVSTVGLLRDALDGQIAGGALHITVDVSGLRFADSASISALLRAHRRLRDRGGALELAFPQPTVARVLVLLGADQVLTVRMRADAGPAGSEPDAS
jgi:anti-sigma B factor antagonist